MMRGFCSKAVGSILCVASTAADADFSSQPTLDQCVATYERNIKISFNRARRQVSIVNDYVAKLEEIETELIEGVIWYGLDPTQPAALAIGYVAQVTKLTADLIVDLQSLALPPGMREVTVTAVSTARDMVYDVQNGRNPTKTLDAAILTILTPNVDKILAPIGAMQNLAGNIKRLMEMEKDAAALRAEMIERKNNLARTIEQEREVARKADATLARLRQEVESELQNICSASSAVEQEEAQKRLDKIEQNMAVGKGGARSLAEQHDRRVADARARGEDRSLKIDEEFSDALRSSASDVASSFGGGDSSAGLSGGVGSNGCSAGDMAAIAELERWVRENEPRAELQSQRRQVSEVRRKLAEAKRICP